MPVYEKGYRGLGEAEKPGRTRWLVLTRAELGGIAGNRKLLLLWIACLGPQIVLLVKMLAAFSVVQLFRGMGGRRGRGGAGGPSPLGSPEEIDFYLQSLLQWSLVPVVVFLAASSVLTVCRDRRHGALELYFTRPIRTIHYVLGRWLGATAVVASLTSLPVVAVWLVGALVAPDWGFFCRTAWIPGHILLQGAFFAGVLGLLAVAVSSLSPSSRTCQVAWVLLIAVMHMVFSTGLRRYLAETWPVMLSPWGAVQRISEALLCAPRPEHDLALLSCLGVVGGLMAAAALVLWRTLRPVEVVG